MSVNLSWPELAPAGLAKAVVHEKAHSIYAIPYIVAKTPTCFPRLVGASEQRSFTLAAAFFNGAAANSQDVAVKVFCQEDKEGQSAQGAAGPSMPAKGGQRCFGTLSYVQRDAETNLTLHARRAVTT